jgi:ATP-binding cassette, subfamily B, bacterial PglK
LPCLNKFIASYNNFQYFRNTIKQVTNDLKIKKENYLSNETVTFEHKIELVNVTFKYQGADDYLFKEVNLEINKGDKVAVIGQSGCGKSTLVDIIMGMLTLDRGEIIVDGKIINSENMKAWRRKFGYIPQEIYLYDASVADNVTFGRDYDESRVIEVLKQANIYDYLQTKEGLETMVGEGGVQLSGGQKQRIGIARALYDDPEILVLDEATSALDNETESLIMDEIYHLSKHRTLIVIAHRLSTLEKCTQKVIL